MKKHLKNILGIVAAIAAVSCMMFSVACGDGDNKGSSGLTYTASELPAAELTVAYTASVATATGADNIKYTMSKGALPAGITLAADGGLSGTPTKDGAFSFTVKATAGTQSATADFSLTVNKHLYDITYDGAMLDIATVGVAYEANVATATSTGTEAITYSTKDTLPAGLALSADGKISGTPTAATTGAVTIGITASAGDAKPVTANFSLTVSATALEMIPYTAADLDDARIGEAYTGSVATVTGVDGVKYELYQGSTLPAGLTLAENGAISGTPTGESASYKFTVVASASGYGSSTAQFTLFVKPVVALAEYTFEAEHTDLTDKKGGGVSGSAEGIEVIDPANAAANCSNGYFVGWTWVAGFTVTFVINSDADATAKLSLSLGSDGGELPLKSSTMTITVNGKNLSYNKGTIPEFDNKFVKFQKYEISANVSLKKGENVIVLTIADNELGNGTGARGPMIDALYLETEAYLSWTPHEFDPKDI